MPLLWSIMSLNIKKVNKIGNLIYDMGAEASEMLRPARKTEKLGFTAYKTECKNHFFKKEHIYK